MKVFLFAMACLINTTTFEAEDCKVIKPNEGVEVPAGMPILDVCQAMGIGAAVYRRSQPDLKDYEIVYTKCYTEKGEEI